MHLFAFVLELGISPLTGEEASPNDGESTSPLLMARRRRR